MTTDPLDTHMEAHNGDPDAVLLLLDRVMDLIEDFPDDLRLCVELDVWEVGARKNEQEEVIEE